MWISYLLVAGCCGTTVDAITHDYQAQNEHNITSYNSSNITNMDMNASTVAPPIIEDFGTGVLSAFTITAVSEIGDKTFFIACVLALSNSAIYVYGGAMSALALMTLLSAGLGMAFSIISAVCVQYVSALLFLVFGLKMLKDGCTMKESVGREEMEEVKKKIENKLSEKRKESLFQHLECGMKRFTIQWVFMEAFTMTFLSEWGDRSQIATVVLAAKHNVGGVILGAVLGHAICTLLAVVAGRLVADHVSIRIVTICGAILFLIFSLTSFIGALSETIAPTTEMPSTVTPLTMTSLPATSSAVTES